MSVMLACMCLCHGDHLFRITRFMCLFGKPITSKMNKYSEAGHQKVLLFLFVPPIRRLGADRFIKHHPRRNVCTARVRAVMNFEKTVSYIGARWRVSFVVTYSPTVSVHACHPTIGHTLRAPPLLCTFQKIGAFLALSCPASALVCFVRFFPKNFFTFFGCPWGRPFCAPVCCSHHVQIKCAKNLRHRSKKPSSNVHSIRAQNRHPRQIMSAT